MDDRLAKYFYERNILTRLSEAESDIDLLQKLQTIKSVDLQTLPVPGDSTPPVLSIIIDTDGTLAANSDERVASQKATKTYADTVSSNASVIAKVLTGFAASAGTVTAADSILSAFQKIVGNLAAMAVGHTIEDEGTPLTQRAKLNFVGGGITATDDSGDNASVVTVSAQTIGDLIEGSTNKATPVDADRFGFWDSVADVLKYATWANVKATLKTYFDPYYRIATAVEKYGAVAGVITIGKDAGKVAAAIASGDTTVNFGRTMTPSDWVRFQGPDSVGTISLEWMLVGSLVSGTTYNVTRNVDGSGANNWLIDSPFVVIGQSGDSRIEFEGGTNGKINLITQGATWNVSTTQIALDSNLGITLASLQRLYTSYFSVYPNTGSSFLEGSYATGSFYFAGIFSASVSGSLTDYSPDSGNKGLLHALRLNATAATELRSLLYYFNTSFVGSLYTGRFINIMNVGTFSITIKDNYTTGTNAESRFDLGGSDLVIPPDGSVTIWYDGTSTVWRVWSVNQIVGDTRFAPASISTIVADGWYPITATWTRTGNHTYTAAGDVTAIYRKGTKVRYKDGGSFEYGVIGSSSHSAGTTTINLIVNSDYAMAAVTITDTYLSYIENPEDFPQWFSWSVSLTNLTVGSGALVSRWKAEPLAIDYEIDFVYGAGSSVGDVSFVPPITSAMGGTRPATGEVAILDSGTGLFYGTVSQVNSTSFSVRVLNTAGTYASLALLSSTIPMTWTTSDELNIKGRYKY